MLKQAWANIKNKTEERESWLVGGRGAGQPVGYSQSRATNLKSENLKLKQQQRRRQRKRHLKRALALSQTSSLLFYLVQFVQNVDNFSGGKF